MTSVLQICLLHKKKKSTTLPQYTKHKLFCDSVFNKSCSKISGRVCRHISLSNKPMILDLVIGTICNSVQICMIYTPNHINAWSVTYIVAILKLIAVWNTFVNYKSIIDARIRDLRLNVHQRGPMTHAQPIDLCVTGGSWWQMVWWQVVVDCKVAVGGR